MIIKTKFEINQKIKIKPFSLIEGKILGFFFGPYGLKYYVSYPVNFQLKEEYFSEDELEA